MNRTKLNSVKQRVETLFSDQGMERGELVLERHLLPEVRGPGAFKGFKVERWDEGMNF